MHALSCALGLRVRVEYLDAKAAGSSERSGPHRHVVCGPGVASDDGSTALPPPRLTACLLYRPGHYDILYPK